MFDIGCWELIVIAIVTLLVVGPERLPGLARDAGLWLGKIRRFINHARREIESGLRISENREFEQQLSDLDKLMRDAPDRDPQYPARQKNVSDSGRPDTPDQDPGS
jgi:sec-independent protein translocase protein TatB